MNLNSQAKDLCVYIKFSVHGLVFDNVSGIIFVINVEIGSLDRFCEVY